MDTKIDKIKSKSKYIVPAILIMLAVLMLASVLFLRFYVKREIHKERSVYLNAQTQTITDLVNSTFDRYGEYADICKKDIEQNLRSGSDVYEFMNKEGLILGIDEANVMVVDSNCVWYGKNKTTGRITAPEYYYSGTDNKLYYITQGTDASVESIVYRFRLDNPIEVKVGNANKTIEYVIVAYYLDNLHNQIKDAFPYNCNRFIMNDDGLMLYKQFELGILVPGSNVKKKYGEVNFLYDDNQEEQLAFIENKEIAIGEFSIDSGEHKGNYFICTSPLDINNWAVVFVIPADSLSAGGYVENMFFVVAIVFAIFTTALCIATIFYLRNLSGLRTIAKEREANELLQQASTAKSTFLANMSHDIRTPINGIMGMTALAKMEKNPDKTNECLAKIEGASEHLLSLVNDVLDMSSIESGKIKIINKPTDIRTIVANCSSIIKGQIGERDLKLVEDFEEVSNPYVLADELHLRQVLINVLSNSVKYTKDGGTIWCRMYQLPSDSNNISRIKIEVEDTGIGMNPEFLNRIWDSFSQEEGGSRTKYKGTGLGMTITKNLVELMGGTISVESTLNVGSTFTIEIPFEITDEKIAEEPKETEKEQKEKRIDGVNILLVEDNELNLEIAYQLISNEGANITKAMNGVEAVNTFKNNPPGTFDIILMDVMMPEMNGLEATETIRLLDRDDALKIPIIAMTANAFDEDIKATQKAGMNAHLSKPINMKAVISTILEFYNGEEK